MHSATPATGRPTQPPGKTVAKNRPAPLITRPAHTPRAAHSQQNRMSHCYIRVSPGTNRAVCVPEGVAGHESQVTDHVISNRHTSRLEIVVSHRKQTLGTHSNRQFFTLLARNFTPASSALRKSQTIPNRHTVRLEIAISHRKQTLDTRSNRHFFTVLARPKSTNNEAMPASSRKTRAEAAATKPKAGAASSSPTDPVPGGLPITAVGGLIAVVYPVGEGGAAVNGAFVPGFGLFLGRQAGGGIGARGSLSVRQFTVLSG